jgi:hypothetical protein
MDIACRVHETMSGSIKELRIFQSPRRGRHMSAAFRSPNPNELAAELGRRSNAVAALVTLSNQGRATLEQLHERVVAHEGERLYEDLSWLAAVGLVRRESAAGTWDIVDRSAVYRLSSLGAAIAASLAALAKTCDTPHPPTRP